MRVQAIDRATGDLPKPVGCGSDRRAPFPDKFWTRIPTLQEIVGADLCTGCGACYYFCDKHLVTLRNIPAQGIRPQFASGCGTCTQCLSICPGYSIDVSPTGKAPMATDIEFGPALEIWEGYALDPDVRFRASSGGILSALALFSLEREGMQFVLHTGADAEHPWLNTTSESRTRAEVVSRTGSRYAPSSPCDGLQSIEDSVGNCVFIGKPCDAAAVEKLRRKRSGLDDNLGLVLTFFCAGTPSTDGTFNILNSLDVERKDVTSIRYRGLGWPGRFTVTCDAGRVEKSMSYEDSWGRLTAYRPLRCNLCPDGLGRAADIACGDAWGRTSSDSEPGRSLVIVRTERGRELLHRAMAAGYVRLDRVDSEVVLSAQRQLLQRRRELFGRLLSMRLLGMPIPHFVGFSLFRSWIRQPLSIQIRSILGTARRLIRRRWLKRRSVSAAIGT